MLAGIRNRTVDNRIIELLHRNLQEVFGEGDAARRRAAIKDFYTDDCVLYAPTGVVIGHDALDKFAGDLTSVTILPCASTTHTLESSNETSIPA
jgi:ketosteroid isomerase-like protein